MAQMRIKALVAETLEATPPGASDPEKEGENPSPRGIPGFDQRTTRYDPEKARGIPVFEGIPYENSPPRGIPGFKGMPYQRSTRYSPPRGIPNALPAVPDTTPKKKARTRPRGVYRGLRECPSSAPHYTRCLRGYPTRTRPRGVYQGLRECPTSAVPDTTPNPIHPIDTTPKKNTGV